MYYFLSATTEVLFLFRHDATDSHKLGKFHL